jgi:transcriptional regulator with XRE-family HTH domain
MSEIFIGRSEEVSANRKRKRDNVTEEFRRKLREAIGNQSDLAERTGISQTTISDLINRDHNPSFAQTVKIARALGLSLEYLADDEMKNPPESRERTDREDDILKLAKKLGYEEAFDLLTDGLISGGGRSRATDL